MSTEINIKVVKSPASVTPQDNKVDSAQQKKAELAKGIWNDSEWYRYYNPFSKQQTIGAIGINNNISDRNSDLVTLSLTTLSGYTYTKQFDLPYSNFEEPEITPNEYYDNGGAGVGTCISAILVGSTLLKEEISKSYYSSFYNSTDFRDRYFILPIGKEKGILIYVVSGGSSAGYAEWSYYQRTYYERVNNLIGDHWESRSTTQWTVEQSYSEPFRAASHIFAFKFGIDFIEEIAVPESISSVLLEYYHTPTVGSNSSTVSGTNSQTTGYEELFIDTGTQQYYVCGEELGTSSSFTYNYTTNQYHIYNKPKLNDPLYYLETYGHSNLSGADILHTPVIYSFFSNTSIQSYGETGPFYDYTETTNLLNQYNVPLPKDIIYVKRNNTGISYYYTFLKATRTVTNPPAVPLNLFLPFKVKNPKEVKLFNSSDSWRLLWDWNNPGYCFSFAQTLGFTI